MTTLLCEFLLQKIPLCACTAVKTAATSVSLTMCLLPSWCACECQLDNVPPGAHARVSLTIFSSPSWAHALANLTMFLLVRMRVSACHCSSLCACVSAWQRSSLCACACQLDNAPLCAHARVSLTMFLYSVSTDKDQVQRRGCRPSTQIHQVSFVRLIYCRC